VNRAVLYMRVSSPPRSGTALIAESRMTNATLALSQKGSYNRKAVHGVSYANSGREASRLPSRAFKGAGLP
jgi:hypothetical protein